MIALSLALIGGGIGLLAGAWVTLPGLVVVVLVALAVIGTGCANIGVGILAAAGYLVLTAVTVQIGYAVMVLTALCGDDDRKARRRQQVRDLVRSMRRNTN